jgi:hypothetical protein
MQTILCFLQLILIFHLPELYTKLQIEDNYPKAEIANKEVQMKLYLPDQVNGYYRGTRFDWSGIIFSLEYKGHQYFGEWSKTRNPVSSSDITGPVNGYLFPGLGYADAKTGGEFIRIGVGALEKPEETNYQMFKTYKIIDNGKWTIDKGKDWIGFRHEIKRENGWGYIYYKRIELTADKPGFRIKYSLKNTGTKTIETDQFNHNFFIIDNGKPGPDFSVKFPFSCKPDNNPLNKAQTLVKIENSNLVFSGEVAERDVWMSLVGYGDQPSDNQFVIVNKLTGAGVQVQMDKPLYQLNFWANKITLCPETFIFLKLSPGEETKWSSTYSVFTVDK